MIEAQTGEKSEVGEVLASAFGFSWTQIDWRVTSVGPLSAAICLTVGLVSGHPKAGMIAAGGSISVGFGAFQRVRGHAWLAMGLATVGIATSTALGMMLARSMLASAALVGIWGAVAGAATALGPGAAWVGLQCLIGMEVGAGFHAPPLQALERGALVLTGGALQTLLSGVLHSPSRSVQPSATGPNAPRPGPRMGFALAWRALRRRSPIAQHAARLGAILPLISLGSHFLPWTQTYWIGITAALVLRLELRETATRAVARFCGTVAGAAVASLIVTLVRPDPQILSAIVVAAAALCYTFQPVNYAVFSLAITAYVVFLLGFLGYPPLTVVAHRVVCTALGGTVALLWYALWKTLPWRTGSITTTK